MNGPIFRIFSNVVVVVTAGFSRLGSSCCRQMWRFFARVLGRFNEWDSAQLQGIIGGRHDKRKISVIAAPEKALSEYRIGVKFKLEESKGCKGRLAHNGVG